MKHAVLSPYGIVVGVAVVGALLLLSDRADTPPITDFDTSSCLSTWMSSTNEIQGGPGSATHELDAILAEVDSSSFEAVLPVDARRIVDTPEDDGFLLVRTERDDAEFVLVVGGAPRGSVTIERFYEGSYAASGSSWCTE